MKHWWILPNWIRKLFVRGELNPNSSGWSKSTTDSATVCTAKLTFAQFLRLSEKNADIDSYEAQLVELQNRLSEAENSAAVTYHLEIERLEGEKAEALSGKKIVEEQVRVISWTSWPAWSDHLYQRNTAYKSSCRTRLALF